MNNTGSVVTKKLIGFLLAGYFCGILFFTVYSIIVFPENYVHRTFMVPWIIDNALNGFIHYCLSIHTVVILFVFSLVLPAGKFHHIGSENEAFFSILKAAFLVFAIFTLLFAFLTEMVQPGIYRRKQAITQKTSMMAEFKEIAENQYSRGNLQEAERYTEYYMHFDKNNAEMELLQRNIHERKRNEKKRETAEDEQGVSNKMGRTPQELIKKARIYFEHEDYLSAHYYAILAHSIDKSSSEARELADRAWEELKKSGMNAQTREETVLFSRKQEAYTALKQGDPVRAYYLFLSLKKEYPHDQDIKKYFRESLEKVEEIAFFKNEVDVIKAIPGFTDILFINKKEKGEIEIVSISHLVPKGGTLYLEDVEVLGTNIHSGPAGAPLYHYRAPYGKLHNGKILLRCIEQERENVYSPVSLLQEEPPSASENSSGLPRTLILNPPVEMLRYLTPENSAKAMNIAVLWDSIELFSKYGYPKEPLQREFFYRIIRLFTFLLASLCACYAGWNLRAAGKGLPLIPVLFLPLFPFALSILFSLYLWLITSLVGFVLVLSRFLPALGFLIATQALGMLVVIMLFARQYHKR